MFNENLSIKEINPNIPFYPMKSVVMMLLSRKCSECIRLDLHKVWVNRSSNFIVTTVRGTWEKIMRQERKGINKIYSTSV